MRTATLIFLISIGMVVSLFVLLGATGNLDILRAFKSESIVGLWYVFGYGAASVFFGILLVKLLQYAVSVRGNNDEK